VPGDDFGGHADRREVTVRYPKNAVMMNISRDIPMLTQVRNSKFISREQLFEFMKAGGYEYSRNSFNWRTRRLLDSGFLAICPGNLGRSATVYHITSEGLMHLEDHGQFAAVLNSKTAHLPHPAQLHHALGLNNIQLTLLRSGLLASWHSDLQIASENTISRTPLGKDYDAIVGIWDNGMLARFALEYERTLKSTQQYKKIRHALESDNSVGCVLYLGSGPEIIVHLVHEFAGIRQRLAFATAQAFQKQLLDTPVLTRPKEPVVAFRKLLNGMF
jgi:hypothetical protein